MRKPLLLFLIFALAAFLRFYKLGSIPNGLYQDETSIGYNALSILETGKDEHGNSWPLYFKSFGDHKLPVYIYLTAASVKLFGLTEWAVRFPSALFGTLTIPLIFFFLQKLFRSYRLSFIASLLLAINPWHLHYSRATFEVSIALFFIILGSLLLARKVLLGTLFFIIAFYSYNLTRLLAPLLYLLALWVYKIKPKPYIFVVSFILLLPFFITLFAGGGAQSARGTFIFTSAVVQAPLLEFRSYLLALPGAFVKLFFNQPLQTAWLYIQNVVHYFSVEFFFLTGSAHGNHGIGNVGQFYLFELPLIIFGFLQALRSSKYTLILGWTVITIAVAALTREAPHATRSFFLLFPMVTFSSIGLLEILAWLRTKQIIMFIGIALVVYNLVYYFSSYYVRFPVAYAAAWRSADKPLALFLKSVEDQYDRIIIDPEAGLMYTSLLFYQSYPTQKFLDSVRRSPDDSEGFSTVEKFGKYEFRPVQWDRDYRTPRTLIITAPKLKPTDIPVLQSFSYPTRPVVVAIKQEIAQYPVIDIAYVAVASAR